jgi:hypothetical protein
MNSFAPNRYGPRFAQLLAIDRRRALDAGKPERGARAALEALSVQSVFAHAKVVDRDMAACCVSGVWLLHDFLDESHTISQGIDTTSGSYWHAIMHRREGDFSNSKYWFRRVGRHAVLDELGTVAASLRDADAMARNISLSNDSEFDPFEFVELAQTAIRGSSDLRDYCLDVQQAEWELLFDHCYQAAVGREE